jgi:hypothetical protein
VTVYITLHPMSSESWKVRITLETLVAVADVAFSTGGVQAMAIAAEACVSVRLVAGSLTGLISNCPIHNYGSPPVVRFVEIQRSGITRQESEMRGIHERCEDGTAKMQGLTVWISDVLNLLSNKTL